MKSELFGHLGMCRSDNFSEMGSDSAPFSYSSYDWPVHSVERLPPYTAAKLKYPVLVIGNMVRAPRPHNQSNFLDLTCTIPRPTQLPHSPARRRRRTSLAMVPSLLSNLVSATRPSLSPPLAHLASWQITM